MTLRETLENVLKEENKEVLDQEIEALGLNILRIDGQVFNLNFSLVAPSIRSAILLFASLPASIEDATQDFLLKKHIPRDKFDEMVEAVSKYQKDLNENTEVM